MPRSRRIAAASIGLTAVLVLAAVVARPFVRERIRRAVVARCEGVTGGPCRVSGVTLSREGIALGGVEIRSRVPGLGVTVSHVAIRLDWWTAVRGASQSVSIRVSDVLIRNTAEPEDVAREAHRWVRLHAEHRAGRDAGRFEVSDVQVVRGRLASVLTEGARVDVRGIAVHWQRGEPLSIEWRSAVVGGEPGLGGDSGECSLRVEPRSRNSTLDCAGFTGRFDANASQGIVSHVRSIVARVRAAWSDGSNESLEQAGSVATRLGGADGADAAAPTIDVRARGGSLTIMRGETEVAALRPADVHLGGPLGRIEFVRASVGGESAGPAVDVDLSRSNGNGWRLDLNAEDLPLRELAHWIPIVPWHGVDAGRADARVRAETAAQRGVVLVEGQVSLENFGLMHRALSHDSIDGLSITARGSGRLDLVHGRIETEGIQVALNGISAAVSGWVARPGAGSTELDVSARLPVTSCDAIRRALPRTLTGPVNDLGFAGTIGVDAHLALDTRRLAVTELEIDADDRCVLARDGMVHGVRRFRGPFVQRVQEPQGLRAFVTGPGSATWVPLARMSPFIGEAVLSREDGRFYQHHGIDVGQIRAAIIRNVAAHRFVYGASTLTMQLAKNVFLAREKTLVRKLQEVVLTWYLEHTMDKDSILELYLNVVEFGPGIYGIGPASRFYFGREPHDLTPLQAIYLATLLPNPTIRFWMYQRGSVTPDALEHLRAHARHMGQSGYLSPAEVTYSQTETLVFRPPSTPVQGALTQNVDPTTTDGAAEAMSPRDAPSQDAAPAGDEDDDSDQGDDTSAGTTSDERERATTPVSVRTGGTI